MIETIPKQKRPFLHPKHETIPIHFCHVFVVTVPRHKQNFHRRFNERLVTRDGRDYEITSCLINY